MEKKQKKIKENPRTLQELMGEKFDYYIDRLHCRGIKTRKLRYIEGNFISAVEMSSKNTGRAYAATPTEIKDFMGTVINIKRKTLLKHWYHKLFQCPTYWTFKGSFTCTQCGKRKRCYWDGNDMTGHGTDICERCARYIDRTCKLTHIH